MIIKDSLSEFHSSYAILKRGGKTLSHNFLVKETMPFPSKKMIYNNKQSKTSLDIKLT